MEVAKKLSIVSLGDHLREQIDTGAKMCRSSRNIADLNKACRSLRRLEQFEPAMFRKFPEHILAGKGIAHAMVAAAEEAFGSLVDIPLSKSDEKYYTDETDFTEKKSALMEEFDAMVHAVNTAFSIAQKILEMKTLPNGYTRKLIENVEFRRYCTKGKSCKDDSCVRMHKCRYGCRCNTGGDFSTCKWFHNQEQDFTGKRRSAIAPSNASSNLIEAAAPAAAPAAAIRPRVAPLLHCKNGINCNDGECAKGHPNLASCKPPK
jgi:hypothetical protein